MQRKFVFMIKRGVSGTCKVQMKSLFLWGISMDMWGNVLRVLKMYTGGIVLGKEMQKEEDCWSFVMKESCAWQTVDFVRQTKGKSLIVPVDVKQKLILCLWEKNIESI